METTGAIVLLVVGAEHWWARWQSGRIAAKLLRAGEAGTGGRKPLIPESLWVVRVSDSGVLCTRPGGAAESVEWDDLRRVELVTTEDGPFAPDVFWVLHGTTKGCVIPQGADGEEALMRRLQALPGFRNEAVIEAGPSAGNARFLCWERREPAGA